MELMYSLEKLDNDILKNSEICGFYDNYGYIKSLLPDLKSLKVNKNMTVKMFLQHKLRNKKNTLNTLLLEFEITESILNKKISNLSSSELIKIIIIKLCLIPAQTIVLKDIDIYLTRSELIRIFKIIKNYSKDIQKSFLLISNKLECLLCSCSRIIIIHKNKIIFNDTKIDCMPIKTDIMKFVDEANKVGANINYYKDFNDLLKAVYRSVQK